VDTPHEPAANTEPDEHLEIVPEVSERMLWHNEFWDGPLDGVCEVDGVPHWFKCANAEESGWPIYLVYEMLPGEWEAERLHHEDWAKTVGRHTEYIYDEQGRRHRRERFRAPAGWHSWYERPQVYARPAFSEDGRQPVAWFGRTPRCEVFSADPADPVRSQRRFPGGGRGS
jgi:hypothetical protein